MEQPSKQESQQLLTKLKQKGGAANKVQHFHVIGNSNTNP